MAAYRDWLAFHIAAQRGMFIDEVVPAPGRAGTMVFSAREADPMWNVLFVDAVPDACRHEALIARAFAARGREPFWYLTDQDGTTLPDGWQATGQNAWMARGITGAAATLPDGLALQPVVTPAQALRFNRLYGDVYWGAAPPPGAAMPIPEAETWRGGDGGDFDVRHWLLLQGEQTVALLTTLCRQGRGSIYNVGTDPTMTRRGYASHAIRAVLAALAHEGVREVFLLTECDPALEPFYARLGFKTVATGRFFRRREAG